MDPRESCVARLVPLGFCVDLLLDPPDRVRFTPCELPSTPNCITQVLIVGGLPGHFRLGWESLKEWVGVGRRGRLETELGLAAGSAAGGAESAAARAPVPSGGCLPRRGREAWVVA